MIRQHDPRYPTGKFTFNPDVTPESRRQCIAAIRETPAALRAAVQGLSEAQLNTPYRDGGWTVRQVVHHVPESHMNAFTRFKLALTETNPTIKPYNEDAWVKLGRRGAHARRDVRRAARGAAPAVGHAAGGDGARRLRAAADRTRTTGR